ncbi:glutathione reductase [Neosynechococcus sphagnicola sy1]|uniref:Glutathione reductase n=1 Tax=Neosynechococcus sphagnicola sy1 TaxID=1497020 RepID=A0A098TJ73_9CYAN|nr:glutathione-disulfide reductase [Neosynechococcus sphagnicola]KGF72052.1 glutathione reductase [Neosynechococcus sphagnicola sy1]
MEFDYNLFVIGAGSGGLAAAKRAASYGARVAIAESDLVGGTCVIRGCVPKKLMVYGSSFSHVYQDATGYGWRKVKPKFDWGTLVTAVDTEVRRLSNLHISFLEKAGVALISGPGTLVDAHTVQVAEERFTAEKILIAVGGEATKPEIPGIEYALTSREMFHLPKQPRRFAVVGGGYIGVEFAGILNGLGSEVTQIVRGDGILRGFDPDIRKELQTAMGNHGIQFLTHTTVERIEKTSKGLKLFLCPDLEKPLKVDAVLYATGRSPNLVGLGLDLAGVAVVNGAIAVNEYSQTSQPHIFAVGDCTDRKNLTPVAIAEGRAFADTEFGNQRRAINYDNIPTAVFGQPEVGTVGMTETEAQDQFGAENLTIYQARFRPMFHSLTGADEKTLMKLVVDKASDRVVGAHMVGKDAAEIIQSLAIAVKMGATKKDLDATMALHPTAAEEFVTMR